MDGDYLYTEQAQQQTGTFQVIPTLFSRPLKLEFRIEYGRGSATPISGSHLSEPTGMLTISNVHLITISYFI
jgi:hypothetical protein